MELTRGENHGLPKKVVSNASVLLQSEPLQQRLQTLIAIQLTNRVVQSDQVPSIDYVESQQKQQDQECRHLSKDRMQVISQGGSRERKRENWFI